MNLIIPFFGFFFLILSATFLAHNFIRPELFDLSPYDENISMSDNICLQTMNELNAHLRFKKHITHRDYKNLYPCILDLNYNFSANFHVIILGSIESAAIKLAQILREKKIEFVEVKNRLHFNLLRDPIWDILSQIKGRKIIIDFHEFDVPYAIERINQFAFENDIPIVRIVREFSNDNDLAYQIKVPEVFGPHYQPNSLINIFYYDMTLNLQNNTCNLGEFSKKKGLIFANDLALFIYDMLNPILAGKINKKIVANLTQYSENELVDFILEKTGKSKKKNKIQIPPQFDENHKIFNLLIPNLSKPYVSHVTTINDLPRVINCYQLILNTISQIITHHPLISVEFICVYSSETDKKFEDLYDIPKNLLKYHKTIIVSSKQYKQITKEVKSEFYPEYILRNIGIAQARGEYIICGSSDVLMPPAFFKCAEELLFSPLSYIRTKRETINPIELSNIFSDYFNFMYSIQYWLHSDIGFTQMSNSLLTTYCGDFQGCHRKMWEIVLCYMEKKYVYNIDSAFSFDITEFLPPLLMVFLPGGKHTSHEVISTKSPSFDLFALYNRILYYNGKSTRHLSSRPFLKKLIPLQ